MLPLGGNPALVLRQAVVRVDCVGCASKSPVNAICETLSGSKIQLQVMPGRMIGVCWHAARMKFRQLGRRLSKGRSRSSSQALSFRKGRERGASIRARNAQHSHPDIAAGSLSPLRERH
jgi:hypothetical protein